MDAHRSSKRTETRSLTDDQNAKLDRLAELARQSPDLMDSVHKRLEDEARIELFMLSKDELKELALKLGIDPC